MSGTMVQIRNVPVDLHRRLKARAAIEGLSMSDYDLREVRKALDRPTREEVIARLRARVAARIADPAVGVHVPHLADVEVAQALRRYVREGELDAASAEEALHDLRDLDVQRHPHEPLLDRVWALRANLTACDAVYVALAEALDATLVTCDGRLARAPGMARRVEVVA